MYSGFKHYVRDSTFSYQYGFNVQLSVWIQRSVISMDSTFKCRYGSTFKGRYGFYVRALSRIVRARATVSAATRQYKCNSYCGEQSHQCP